MEFVQVQRIHKISRLQWMQYGAALLVICVHCGPILENPAYNHLLKGALCRVAVPFFALSTAFFVREKSRWQPGYFRTYMRSLVKNYLVWSVAFLPLGMLWLQQNLTLPLYLYPAALLVGVFYTGTFYHLWYIPALLLALWLGHFLVGKFPYKVLLSGFGCLYLFGCMETYYGFLPEGGMKVVVDAYLQLFVTTRNGLLFVSIFVVLGFLISDYQDQLHKLSSYYSWGLVVSMAGLILEERLIFGSGNLDSNFLISLVPLSFCLFLWGLAGSQQAPRIKNCSKYYYFIHPYAIFVVQQITQQEMTRGWEQFLLVVVITHGMSWLLVMGKGKLTGRYLSRL
ncbi:acyltransferase [Enterococcus sp. 669A]|uniref:Acyltransferase n=1 Tax=Candidatus Enterococcus moelleringii TaxID=2815325 RepID=A0ABS3LEK3_9ENTE|nr:acyltransferase [Enterococcus sp. 669A]MBO1308053.1 acyltransferase [Enterococcus sp. 669A]